MISKEKISRGAKRVWSAVARTTDGSLPGDRTQTLDEYDERMLCKNGIKEINAHIRASGYSIISSFMNGSGRREYGYLDTERVTPKSYSLQQMGRIVEEDLEEMEKGDEKLVWRQIHYDGAKVGEVVLMPSKRVNDFIRGRVEEARSKLPGEYVVFTESDGVCELFNVEKLEKADLSFDLLNKLREIADELESGDENTVDEVRKKVAQHEDGDNDGVDYEVVDLVAMSQDRLREYVGEKVKEAENSIPEGHALMVRPVLDEDDGTLERTKVVRNFDLLNTMSRMVASIRDVGDDSCDIIFYGSIWYIGEEEPRDFVVAKRTPTITQPPEVRFRR